MRRKRVTGLPEAARPPAQGALALQRQHLGDQHPHVALSLCELALIEARRGDAAAAEVAAREALAVQQAALLGPEHPDRAQALMAWGMARMAAGDPAGAEPALREALAIGKKAVPPTHWPMAELNAALGECLRAQGRPDEAGPLLEESYRTFKASFGENHPQTVAAQGRRAGARRDPLASHPP